MMLSGLLISVACLVHNILSDTPSITYLQLNDNTLRVLTTTDHDLKLINPSITSTTQYEWSFDETQICSESSSVYCIQPWTIRTSTTDCPITIDGEFAFEYELSCNEDESVEFQIICNDKIEDLSSNTVDLALNTYWIDENCNSEIMKVELELESEMTFYQNSDYGTEMGTNDLFTKSDTVYAEITINNVLNAHDFVDATIENLWLCTTQPSYQDTVGEGGCISNEIDTNGLFWPVQDEQSVGDVNSAVLLKEVDNDQVKIRFSFDVPYSVARDTLFVDSQIKLTMDTSGNRRMLLVDYPTTYYVKYVRVIGETKIDLTLLPPKPFDIEPNYHDSLWFMSENVWLFIGGISIIIGLVGVVIVMIVCAMKDSNSRPQVNVEGIVSDEDTKGHQYLDDVDQYLMSDDDFLDHDEFNEKTDPLNSSSDSVHSIKSA